MMTFKEAAKFPVPFGKYKGQALDKVASTDDGLSYLDWMRGLDTLFPKTAQALAAYLDDPAVKRDLDALKEAKNRGRFG